MLQIKSGFEKHIISIAAIEEIRWIMEGIMDMSAFTVFCSRISGKRGKNFLKNTTIYRKPDVS
jgi:hypothetical protein